MHTLYHYCQQQSSRIRGILLLFLIISLTGIVSRAQFTEGGYYLKKFGYADGYIGTRCINAYLDRTGRFWLANNLGLSSFDGTEFFNYTTKNGLSNGRPSFFAEDKNGVLYLSAEHTISVWIQGRKPQFHTLYRLPAPDVLADIAVIDSNDFYYTSERENIGHIANKKTAPVAGITERIVRLARNKDLIYGISEAGNIYVIRNGRQITKYPVPTGRLSIGLALPPFVTDKKGNSWFISTKLYRLSSSGITDSLPLPDNAATEYYRIAFDGNGHNFYAMARNWLYYYNGSSINTVPFQLSVADSTTAAVSSMCRGLYTDGNGIVYKADDILGFAQLTRLNYSVPPTLLWVPASDGYNGRVFSYDTNLTRHPYMRDVLPDIGAKILSIYDDRQGNTLYCLLDGLAIQKKGEKTYSYLFKGDSTHSNTIGDQSIGVVLEDQKGNLWAKGQTHIVYLSTNNRKKVYETEASHFKICLDKNDDLWTAGMSHLYVCNEDTISDVTSRMPVKLKTITSLANDRNGNVWISGSNYTIYKITTGSKGQYLCTDSIVLDQRNKTVDVQCIQFDSRGNLWAAFPDYLYIFFADGKGGYGREHYLCLTQEDGIGNLFDGHLINMQRTVDGNILLLEPPMPVLRVDEILKYYRRDAPRVYFTDLLLFGREHDWVADGMRLRADGLPEDLDLPYSQNTLTFRFSNIGFHNTGYYHYQYRLLGMEGNWQDADITRKVTYNNLPPGHYTFQVRGASENGFMSEPLSYSFTISPPWYKSWWAITLWILLSCGILLTAFYLRQRAIVRKYQAEQMITEQKLIALRAQINPHFLQNTFAFLAQHVLYETKESTVNAIKKVSAYLRSVLRGSDNSVVTLEEELEFTEEYLRLQQMLFHNRFTYSVDIADDVDTFGIQVPSMLFQPLAENAVKYGTMYNDDCSIELQVTQELPYTVCTLRNTGSRQQVAEKETGHISKGMQLTRNKLELVFAKSKHKPVFTAGYTGTGEYTVVIKIPLA